MAQTLNQESALPVEIAAANVPASSWGTYVPNVQAGTDNPTDMTPIQQRGIISQAPPLAQNPAPAPMSAPASAPVVAPPVDTTQGALPAATPQMSAPMQEYMQALNQYKAVLDQQSNQGSKVPWFQIAGALANPGRTGSFGEAMGNAANAMAAHQNEQQKMQIPLAQARLGLIKSKYELGKQAQAQEDFAKIAGGQLPPMTTSESSVVPTSADLPHPSAPDAPSAITLEGATAHPRDVATAKPISMKDVLAFAATHPEDKERIAVLTKAAEMAQPSFSVNNSNYVLNNKTGKLTGDMIPGQKQEKFTTPFGDFMLRPQDYEKVVAAPPEKQLDVLRSFVGVNEHGAPRSVHDVEAEVAGRKEMSTGQAKADVAGAQTLLNDRRAGEAMLPVYERIQTILGQPGVKEQLGLFKKGDMVDVLTSFLNSDHSEKATRSMQESIRRVAANSKDADNLINAINDIDGQRGIAEAEYMKSMPGNARVTDFRLKFAQGLHPSSQDDMYGAFQARLNEFKNRAAWDVEKHDLFTNLNNKRNVTYTQFYTQPEYVEAYNRHGKAYAAGLPTNTPAPTGTTPTTPAGSVAQRLAEIRAKRDAEKLKAPQ